jgi:hypothetical protein
LSRPERPVFACVPWTIESAFLHQLTQNGHLINNRAGSDRTNRARLAKCSNEKSDSVRLKRVQQICLRAVQPQRPLPGARNPAEAPHNPDFWMTGFNVRLIKVRPSTRSCIGGKLVKATRFKTGAPCDEFFGLALASENWLHKVKLPLLDPDPIQTHSLRTCALCNLIPSQSSYTQAFRFAKPISTSIQWRESGRHFKFSSFNPEYNPLSSAA